MFERLKNLFGKAARKMDSNLINKKIHKITETLMTDKMYQEIQKWQNLYAGEADWLKEDDKSLNLPCVISSEIARQVVIESQIEITGENARAKFLDNEFNKVRTDIRRQTEYACAYGGICLKPYVDVDNSTIGVDYIQADRFYPIAYNSGGKITSAMFIETLTIDKDTYARVEIHKPENDGYVITNEAYKVTKNLEVKSAINLTDVDKWKDIEPETRYTGNIPLFSYFRIPLGNIVDTSSPLGVSVYSRAVKNIRDADKQYQFLSWEYDGGQLAIDVSEDVFGKEKGKINIPQTKKRLFRPNKIDSTEGNNELMKTFSPELRDESYLRGLNNCIQKIEDLCGLARGTLSDLNYEAKTATEIINQRQRSYATVADIQTSLQTALEDLIIAMNALCDLYNLTPDGEYSTSYNWDDSIISDAETERARDLAEVAAGAMMMYEYRMKWYGEDEVAAKRILAENNPTDDELMGFGNLEEGD